MPTEYTPTTDAVRRVYSLAPVNLAGCDHLNTTPDYAGDQFNRWLAAIRAAAWNEGREYEASQAIQGWNGSADDNPYLHHTWITSEEGNVTCVECEVHASWCDNPPAEWLASNG